MEAEELNLFIDNSLNLSSFYNLILIDLSISAKVGKSIIIEKNNLNYK